MCLTKEGFPFNLSSSKSWQNTEFLKTPKSILLCHLEVTPVGVNYPLQALSLGQGMQWSSDKTGKIIEGVDSAGSALRNRL